MIGGVLRMGRGVAVSRMTDQCKVTRKDKQTWDEDAGEWRDSEYEIFSGRCRVKHPTTMGAQDADVGSQLLVIAHNEIHLPVSAVGVAAGDTVTITASDTRAEQVGRQFIVTSQFDGTQTTALRFRVEAFDER